jgi:uncharacterized protein (TIGR00369 family)
MTTPDSSTRKARSREEQAAVEAAVCDLYERRIAFNGTLGLRAELVGDDRVPRLVFDMRPDLVGHYLYGRLHGGVIATALDAAGSFALMVGIAARHHQESADAIVERFARMGTIDMRIDYLRQGIGNRFIASAEITRLGGRIGSTIMRLHNESGTLIATGAASYVVN